ncbi:MAG: ammonia-forming cytochrome c nitrite reductase subunit c552 [Clostridia bacterium]|nr:ammonia-forming cytochrome c nitrite reductase subunit c552 [Clostridia bacterium]
MEKKTIAMLVVSAVILILGVIFACGIGRGGEVTYQQPGPYTAESSNDFSNVQVAMTIQGDEILDAAITSSGDSDLLTDDLRAEWAQSIVDNQSYENDVISSATLKYSAASVKEASADIFTQAGLPTPEPAATPEPEPESEPEPEAPADEAVTLADGNFHVEKTTDFSTIDVGITVDGGKVTDASVTSAALEGQVDMLTDDIRNGWASQIVEKQAVDAVSGVTVSSDAVQEAVSQLMVQVNGGEAAELTDGTYHIQKTTDFSTIDVEITVEGGKVAAANITSEGANDLLTDDNRAAWAEQIIEGQAVDAVSGVTISSSAVQEAVAELMGQATGGSEAAADDGRIAELEAALAEAEARAEAAEAKAAETEAKVAELEAAAAAAVAATVAPVTEAAEAPAASEPADISRFTRPRPEAATVAPVTEAEEAPAASENADISRFTRPRPEAATVAPVTEAEEAPASTENADISRFTRPRPEAATVAPVTEAEEAPAATENADISRFTRPRPGTVAEDEVGAPEDELTEEERLKAILPGIVTTMGDNRENSYVVDYLEQDPYLVNIYEGYGFAKDYGSARGHEYTLEDVAKTQRPHPKANCITCKTPDLHKMIEEQGVAVYSMPFDEVFPQMTNNVSCYTCHGDDMGNGGALKVTHQYVNEALGENVSTINPATLSCGQCHIEYYFTPADSETMMPYHSVEEMTPEAILAYYDDMGFADWTQESTGTAMLKAQHPEMETFLQGRHAAFLSCADCHMPTETTDAGVAFRSHMLVSPLENEALLASCAQCHGDTDMTAFVKDIQQKVTARETEVGNRLSAMKDALAAAVASGAWSEDDLNAVRKLHREAQWFFDFCYVENSEGAHNSELSMHCLDTADAKIDEAMALLEKATT